MLCSRGREFLPAQARGRLIMTAMIPFALYAVGLYALLVLVVLTLLPNLLG